MGWKCVPQAMGLVRGEPKPGQKHRANGGKICKEAGSERASKSKTLDRTRSKYNRYSDKGYESGAECWAAMEAEADAYRVQVRGKDGVTRERALRADAVIGWAMIIKPPAEVAENWDMEARAKFYNDAWAVMREIEPRLFRQSGKRMIAEHMDEDGPHVHIVGVPCDKDGKYCGNLIDTRLFERINAEFPRMMRKRGWKDLEDVEQTDWKRYNADPEYRAAVDARKAAGGGKGVNEYAAAQTAAKAEAAAAMYADAEDELKAARRDRLEAKALKAEAGRALKEAQEAAQEAQEDREAARRMKSQAEAIKAAGEAVTASQGRSTRRLPTYGD